MGCGLAGSAVDCSSRRVWREPRQSRSGSSLINLKNQCINALPRQVLNAQIELIRRVATGQVLPLAAQAPSVLLC